MSFQDPHTVEEKNQVPLTPISPGFFHLRKALRPLQLADGYLNTHGDATE